MVNEDVPTAPAPADGSHDEQSTHLPPMEVQFLERLDCLDEKIAGLERSQAVVERQLADAYELVGKLSTGLAETKETLIWMKAERKTVVEAIESLRTSVVDALQQAETQTAKDQIIREPFSQPNPLEAAVETGNSHDVEALGNEDLTQQHGSKSDQPPKPTDFELVPKPPGNLVDLETGTDNSQMFDYQTPKQPTSDAHDSSKISAASKTQCGGVPSYASLFRKDSGQQVPLMSDPKSHPPKPTATSSKQLSSLSSKTHAADLEKRSLKGSESARVKTETSFGIKNDVQGKIHEYAKLVVGESEETVPANESSLPSEEPTGPSPETLELPKSQKKDKKKGPSEKELKAIREQEKKMRKETNSADRTLELETAQAAKNAKEAAEDKQKEHFNRMIKLYIEIMQKQAKPKVIPGFDDVRAKQFLTDRIHNHERNGNTELALCCSVLKNNLTPQIVADCHKIWSLARTSYIDSLFMENNNLAIMKSKLYWQDAFEFFKNGNMEKVQQYAENFVDCYVETQQELRNEHKPFYGDESSRKLLKTITTLGKCNNKEMKWAESKKFFEGLADIYQPPISNQMGFFRILFMEASKKEHPVLLLDGHILSRLFAKNKDGKLLGAYQKLLTTVCTL